MICKPNFSNQLDIFNSSIRGQIIIKNKFVHSFCWSPCGTAVLFTTSEQTQIFSLRFTLNEETNEIISAGAAGMYEPTFFKVTKQFY